MWLGILAGYIFVLAFTRAAANCLAIHTMARARNVFTRHVHDLYLEEGPRNYYVLAQLDPRQAAREKEANDNANRLAVEGADKHTPIPHVVQRLQRQETLVRDLQMLQITFLETRASVLRETGNGPRDQLQRAGYRQAEERRAERFQEQDRLDTFLRRNAPPDSGTPRP